MSKNSGTLPSELFNGKPGPLQLRTFSQSAGEARDISGTGNSSIEGWFLSDPTQGGEA